jgi:hypothetical protein
MKSNSVSVATLLNNSNGTQNVVQKVKIKTNKRGGKK